MIPIIKLAVYGTLKGYRNNGVRSLGKCTIPGALYDLGAFPGLKHAPNRFCIGELLEIPAEVLVNFDRYEGYREDDPAGSLYIRKLTTVSHVEADTNVEAFVYYFNHAVSESNRIATGEW